MKGFEKYVGESLGFLDIPWIRWTLIIILILYIVGLIPMFTEEIITIFHNPIIKILIIVFILYIAAKDLPLALLIAVAFILSMHLGYKYDVGLSLGPGIQAALGGGVAKPEKEDDENDEEGYENMTNPDDDIPEGGNYNQYFDCVKECVKDEVGKGALDTPCKGVGVWKQELNAQGLNCPLGFSGEKIGSPF